MPGQASPSFFPEQAGRLAKKQDRARPVSPDVQVYRSTFGSTVTQMVTQRFVVTGSGPSHSLRVRNPPCDGGVRHYVAPDVGPIGTAWRGSVLGPTGPGRGTGWPRASSRRSRRVTPSRP